MIIQIEPWINEKELEQLTRVVDSTFVTEAKLTEEFEELTKRLTNAKHAIAMTNGTMALFAALKALDIGYGDEVLVPDITFIASANAVILAGAKPVFCDVYSDTFCISIEEAEKKITNKTKAIMPVHLYGQSADLYRIQHIALKHNLKIIEDAAQGVGVQFDNKHVGTFGDIGVLSYYGNKTITCGEGGMILTNDDELAKRCYRLKNHGRDTKGTFMHEHIGFNFSFTEMQAAIGIAQMHKLPQIIETKKNIHDFYTSELSDIKNLSPVVIDSRTKPVFWFTSFLTDCVDELAEFLKKYDIQTRRFFYPLHMQPCYQDTNLVGDFNINEFPVSTNVFERGISLPSSYQLNNKEQEQVVLLIKKFYENRD
jgi:perosamine synthetase